MSQRISYHPGFYSATELEFREDVGRLEFAREYNLSKEPLRMDMLIIFKNDDEPLENDVGKIFKHHNIIEYKSPKDSLNIDDYYKTIAYASIYKSMGAKVNDIDADQITISIFWDKYPRKLMDLLKKSGAIIEQPFRGIYYIKEKVLFPTQIVVMRQLDDKTHAAFRVLSDHATEMDVRNFLDSVETVTTQRDLNNTRSVLSVSSMANKSLYGLLREDNEMKSIIDEMIEERLEERLEEKLEERLGEKVEEAQKESAKRLLKCGKFTVRDIAEGLNLPLDTVRELSLSLAK